MDVAVPEGLIIFLIGVLLTTKYYGYFVYITSYVANM